MILMTQEYEKYSVRQAEDAKPCSCEKTTCMIGIASIAIGIGGFIIAGLM